MIAVLAINAGDTRAHGLLGEVHYRRDELAAAAQHFARSGQRAKAAQLEFVAPPQNAKPRFCANTPGISTPAHQY